MAINITEEIADELDTCVITVSFTDEAGDAMTPDAGLKWSLTDMVGNVVNSLADVAITPDTSIEIVLTGADLSLLEGESGQVRRCLHIEGTYSSSAGSDLALNKDIYFRVSEGIDH